MGLKDNPGYQRLVRKGGRMMARILQHTNEKTTATVHALAEPGEIGPDLFNQIAEVCKAHPEKDVVIFIQRFAPEDLKG